MSSWHDARFGTLANLLLLAGVVYGFASRGPTSLRAEYEGQVGLRRPAAAGERLVEADLALLPAPVQRYLRGAGVLGRPRPHQLRATWRGRIRSDPASPWMAFTAEQLNTFDPPRRFFKMDATRAGLPVDVLHAFDEGGATMRVRLLSLFTMVDASGPAMTRAETVTVFNDLCVLAPAALASPRITWAAVDDRAARGRFTLGATSVSAELRFNDLGELVDFVSDDRAAGSADGATFTPMRWSTPLRDYAQMSSARVATRGDAVWHPPAGAFAYGEFELLSLAYDVEP